MKSARSPHAVITRLHGGLGNQLFEYATGHSLARRLGVPHKVDTRVFGEAGERPLELAKFNVPLDEATADELRSVAPQWGRCWKNKYILWRQRITPFHRRRWIREESFNFDARLFTVQPPVYLDGWWQSERYFADHADEVRAMFRPSCAPSPRTETLGAALRARPTVAVHVRRGDYVHDPNASLFHGCCSSSYYTSAIRWIREQLPSAEFCVFSDDFAWARENIPFAAPVRYMENFPAHTAHEDFFLLNQCSHFIIANSSFSWWPAWMKTPPARLVVAPRRWFRGFDINPEHRFPANWHLIDA